MLEIVNPLLPLPKTRGRKRHVCQREILNAIFYQIHNGGIWSDLPSDLPADQTVYNTFDGGNTRAFGNRFMMPCGRTCGYLWANNRKRVRVQLKVAVQIKLHSEKDPTAGASATEAKTTIDGADG